MSNYFNQLSLRQQLNQLGQCRFMDASEFEDGITVLEGKKIVIVGCGAQGLESRTEHARFGLGHFSYALRQGAIEQKRASYQNAVEQ